MNDRAEFSYVLPVRFASEDQVSGELADYLRRLSALCEDVIVVDGSPPPVFAAAESMCGSRVRHVAPEERHRCKMGKVAGVMTGLELARHDRVVIADDDVRYDAPPLNRLVALLERYDLVRPQNYFSPLPWHAVWDSARTLLNRSFGADFPGTLGVRRSTLLDAGGYDGDVIFENLELIRTVRAAGGTVASPLDLYVRRLPPPAAHFWGQRTRQAYDDFAIPPRMALWLSLMPLVGAAMLSRRPGPVVAGAAGCASLAELGRRRAGGSERFPIAASLLAPAWVAERAICAWLAVLQLLRFGGVRYGDSVIRVAAHSERRLRRKLADDRPVRPARLPGPARQPRAGCLDRPDRVRSAPSRR